MEDLDSLIIKYIDRLLSEEDLKILSEKIDNSEEDREYFAEKVNALLYIRLKNLGETEDVELESAFEKINKKINKKSSKKRLPRIIGVISRIAAVLILPMLIYIYQDSIFAKKEIIAKIETVEYSTPAGVRKTFILPDSSVVYLNSESKISFPKEFKSKERWVHLDGEGFFEVKKNKNKRFIVKTNNIDIRVYGTVFNVRSYGRIKSIETTLVSGSVSILPKYGKEILLKPNQKATFNKQTKNISINEVCVKKYTAWKDGAIVFSDTPMKEAIIVLEKWYGIQIELQDESLLKYKFTGYLKDKSLSQVLNLLSQSSPIAYSIDKGKVKIRKK